MKKWIIILIAIVGAIIIGFTISTYIVFSPFLDMTSEIDELNSMDMDEIANDILKHPAAIAFMEKYPNSYFETSNLGVGGIDLIIISENGSQLTINQDTDGTVTNVVYICYYSDGLSSESFDGDNVAEQIPLAC